MIVDIVVFQVVLVGVVGPTMRGRDKLPLPPLHTSSPGCVGSVLTPLPPEALMRRPDFATTSAYRG
jgi:hypothetical protein